MTKSEFIARMSDSLNIGPTDAKNAVEEILASISDELGSDGRIEIRGFGSFCNNDLNARRARNPSTGERVDVGDRKRVFFKPGKELKRRVNASRELAIH